MKKWIKRESSNPLEHLNFIFFCIEKIIKEITYICPWSLFFTPTLYTPCILSFLQTYLDSETKLPFGIMVVVKIFKLELIDFLKTNYNFY